MVKSVETDLDFGDAARVKGLPEPVDAGDATPKAWVEDLVAAGGGGSVTLIEIELTDDPGEGFTGFEGDGDVGEGPFIIPDLSQGTDFTVELDTQFAGLLALMPQAMRAKAGGSSSKPPMTATIRRCSSGRAGGGVTTAMWPARRTTPFASSKAPAHVQYVIDPEGRWRVEIDAVHEVFEITPPPPPPCTFRLTLEPMADPLSDPTIAFQSVEFLDADGVSVFPNMTSSTAPAPLHAYGITNDESYVPAEDVNAFKALDGNPATAFGGVEIDAWSAWLFLDSGSLVDTGVRKVRVTPGVSSGDAALYVNAYADMAQLIDNPPGVWGGAYFGEVSADVAIEIDLVPGLAEMLYAENEIPAGWIKCARRFTGRGGYKFEAAPPEGAAKVVAAAAVLPTTDAWAARALEDRIDMPDDRKAYRDALRRIKAGEDIAWPDEPAPFNPAPQVPKRIVEERLEARGKYAVAVAALQAVPANWARWQRPGDFNVHTADVAARELIAGLGEDPDEILAPTIGV